MLFAAFFNLRVTADGCFLVHRQRSCALGDWEVGHSAGPRSSHQSVKEVNVSLLFPVRQWSCLMNVSWICGEERILSFTVEIFEWWLGTCIWKWISKCSMARISWFLLSAAILWFIILMSDFYFDFRIHHYVSLLCLSEASPTPQLAQ